MSAGTVSRKPTERDIAEAVRNLCRIKRVSETDARQAFEYSNWNFFAAQRRLDAISRQREDEQAERDFQQAVLLTRYQCGILPKLSEWAGLIKFDPLRNPNDAYSLISRLVQQGYAVDMSHDKDTFKVRVSKEFRGYWQSGQGIGDTLREAVVMAWQQAIGEGIE